MENKKVKLRDKLSDGWLQVNIVFEILGKPKEHIIEVLNAMIKKLGEQEYVEIIEKKVHDPHEVKPDEKKGQKEVLFSSFAELEIVVKTFHNLVEIIFDYMPASVEVIKPNDLKFKLNEANAVLNDLTARLHQYHMAARTLQVERTLLANKLKSVLDKEKK